MLVRGTSRTGQPILLAEGRPLNSTYDPVHEAQRFARAALASGAPSPTVILVGAVMGYVEAAIAAQAGQARLLRIALSPDVAAFAPAAADDAAPLWHPGSGESLPAFLAKWLDESDLTGLRVVEWAPCTAAWPEEARRVQAAIRAFVDRLAASYATTATFGPLWLRNALANFVGLPALGSLAPAEAGEVVLIAASGPTLEEAMPSLTACRRRMRLWALPSSVRALAHAGLRPDMVVLTDPGLYALQHLPAGLGVPIAMPLAASRGCRHFADTALLFAQPCVFEKDLAEQIAPWPLPVIPPQGTVAASALGLAAALGYRTIVFAGLDFCYRDVVSHARPNLSEIYHASRACRLAPADGALYGQAAEAAETDGAGARATAGLRAYAHWFATATLPAGVRVHRLIPSAVDVPSADPLDPRDLPALLPGAVSPLPALRRIVLRHDRGALARETLARWSDELRQARGLPIGRWTARVRELALYLDLPGYARARSGAAGPERTMDAVSTRLQALRSRLAGSRP